MDQPDDYQEVEHVDQLALSDGTVALTFVADEIAGRHTLFSKDARDYGDGGHLTAFLRDGRIEVRLQDTARSVSLTSRSQSPGLATRGDQTGRATTSTAP